MGGGSFLGTAAAAAVGTIGGSLLFNGIRNLMGGGHPAAFGNYNDPLAAAASPWGSDATGSDLARGAGVNDVNDVNTGNFGSSRFAGDDTAPGSGAYDVNDDTADQLADDDDFADSNYGDDGTTDA
jgi:hypothetical protein